MLFFWYKNSSISREPYEGSAEGLMIASGLGTKGDYRALVEKTQESAPEGAQI